MPSFFFSTQFQHWTYSFEQVEEYRKDAIADAIKRVTEHDASEAKQYKFLTMQEEQLVLATLQLSMIQQQVQLERRQT